MTDLVVLAIGPKGHYRRAMTDPVLRILVDRRERGKILKDLEALPSVTIETTDLDVGDYVLGDGTAVERKSATDFILSIVDQSLFEKGAKLRSRYPRASYIVEGDLYTRRFHQKAFDVHGALAHLTVYLGVPVLTSPDSEQTAMLLYLMAAEAQGHGRTRSRPPVPTVTLEAQTFALEGLPGISADTAERLLESFGTLQAIFTADPADWVGRAGMSERDAAALSALLAARWPGAASP